MAKKEEIFDRITQEEWQNVFDKEVAGRIPDLQDYIDKKTLQRYDAIDINVYQANMFHTKMLIKEVDLQNYLFKTDVYEIAPKTRLEITNNLRKEMIEIFSGSNVFDRGEEEK